MLDCKKLQCLRQWAAIFLRLSSARFLFMNSLFCQSRTLGARESEQDPFGKATFFMPAGLEGSRGEDERDCWWTTVFCWPLGRGCHSLWCDWQSHLRTDFGRCYSAYWHIVYHSFIVFWGSMSLILVWHLFSLLSVWEECLLCGRSGSYNEAASSLANPFAPNSTLLSRQMQQQSNCYRSSCCFWHWICLHQ